MKLLPYTLNLALYEDSDGFITICTESGCFISEITCDGRPRISPRKGAPFVLSKGNTRLECLLYDLCADLLEEARKKGGAM